MKIPFPDRRTSAGEARFQRGLMIFSAATALVMALWTPFVPAYLGIAALAGLLAFVLQWFEWQVLSARVNFFANLGLCVAVGVQFICQQEILTPSLRADHILTLTLQYFLVFTFAHGALHTVFPSVLAVRPMRSPLARR